MFPAITRLSLAVSAIASLVIAKPAEGRHASELGAQGGDHSFILALVDSIPRREAVAAIVRYPDADKPPVVLINQAAATPRLLVAVLGELDAVRSLDPPATAVEYHFIQSAKPIGAVPEAKLRLASDALEKVRQQSPSQIGNIGIGRWLKFPDSWIRAKRRA